MNYFDYLQNPDELITRISITFFVVILVTPITTIAELQYNNWRAVTVLAFLRVVNLMMLINEPRTKYPLFTAILERNPEMDLKEVVSVMLLVDPERWLLKTHALKVSLIGEDKVTDQMVEEKINELRANDATLAGVLESILKRVPCSSILRDLSNSIQYEVLFEPID